jgi:hypothetical protein
MLPWSNRLSSASVGLMEVRTFSASTKSARACSNWLFVVSYSAWAFCRATSFFVVMSRSSFKRLSLSYSHKLRSVHYYIIIAPNSTFSNVAMSTFAALNLLLLSSRSYNLFMTTPKVFAISYCDMILSSTVPSPVLQCILPRCLAYHSSYRVPGSYLLPCRA